MTQEKLERINELARVKRLRALTPEEAAEQALLRREYLDEWRAGVVEILENTYIVDENGVSHKMEKKKRRGSPER